MKQRVYFEHLSCSHCAMKIEEKLEKRKLFPEVAVSFATGVILVESDHPVSEGELAAMQKICDDIEPGVTLSLQKPGTAPTAGAVPDSGHDHDRGEHGACDCGHDHDRGEHDACDCGHDHSHGEHDACGCGHDHNHGEHGTCDCEHDHGHGEHDACDCRHDHGHGEHDACGCGHDHGHGEHDACGCGHDHSEEAAVEASEQAARKLAARPGTQTLRFTGLSCSHCAMKIEERLEKSGRFEAVSVSFATGTILIRSLRTLNLEDLTFVQQVCDDVEPGVQVSLAGAAPSKKAAPSEEGTEKRPLWPLLLAVVLAVAGMVSEHLATATVVLWIADGLLVAACALACYDVWYKGVTGIFKKRVDENLLVTVAVIASFFLGEFGEAAMVALLFKISLYLEDRAVGATRKSLNAITNIQPETAAVAGPGGQITETPAEQVQVGDEIVIRPSDRVPLDCVILSGSTAVDKSAITGESLPVNAAEGDALPSGGINLSGLVRAKVTSPLEESTAARIIKLVEESAAQKSKSQKFITRFAAIYTPVILLCALLVAILPPLTGLGSWNHWIYTALVFVVSACPCALVISIPLGFYAGIGAASKRGVLIKGGKHIENLAKLTDAVFDKTGTLTDGKLQVTEVKALADLSEEEVLAYSALAEQYSNHPISRSIVAQCPQLPAEKLLSVEEIAGKGVRAQLEGRELLCGSARLLRGAGVAVPEGIEANVLLAIGGQCKGYVAVGDQVRPDSRETMSQLKALGVRTAMLTGDSAKAAAKVAGQLGLDDYRSDLLPQDKVDGLLSLKGEGKTVAFVGDGINDAPVLAASDVGVAMGFGTDAAIEAADVVLVSGKPSSLPSAVKLSRRVMNLIKFNIAFALIVKFLVIGLSLFGLSTIWMAVFADVGVTVLSVLNVTRLLLGSKKQ